MQHIGFFIKKRREQLGWTQEELASKMGYKSTSTIAKIESGINDVTQKNIIKFSRVLNISVDFLMDINEDLKSTHNDYISTSNFPSELIEQLSMLDERKLVLVLAYLKALNGQD